MDPLREEVRQFADHWFGRPAPPEGEGDLLAFHRWEGDDAFEFLEAFADRFGVDLSGYVWWFHHADEGELLSPSWPISPLSRSVPRIPVSLDLLAEVARAKRWPVDYPPHDPVPRHTAHWNLLFHVASAATVLAAALSILLLLLHASTRP